MSIKDNHSRRVSFDVRQELGDKIDKLMIMIGKLVARDSRSGEQFKPQIYQGKGRGQNRSSYDRWNMISEVIRIDRGHIVKTGNSIDKREVDNKV